MNELKLTMELLPKGAWGNDLSIILPKKDWNILREFALKRANGKCEVCGYESDDLDVHEEWEFDIKNKTQTLKDIIAICSSCHGVKHFRNSRRIGFEEEAKKHFMEVNDCNEFEFAAHSTQAEILFNERNEIYFWKMKLNLLKFGGEEISIPDITRLKILNPYSENDLEDLKNKINLLPRILNIEVNNYSGDIIVKSDISNKIVWYVDGKVVKTQYNFARILKSDFSVVGLKGENVQFDIFGDYGKTNLKEFKLEKWEY